MIKLIQKKINRLVNSRNYYKALFLFKKIFGEKDLGNLNFDFESRKNRMSIVQEIIDKKNYSSYLEIGTFKDELFSEIKCKKKVGVDPTSGGTNRETSDSFFLKNNDKFDCIFIDGLHYYYQVKKDIINSLNSLNDDGIILMHDCLPKNVFAQMTPRCTWDWNGDVWKALVEFRTKPSLDCYTCYADHGIGVILKRKNNNPLYLDLNDFSKLKFENYFYNHKKLMNIVEFQDLIKII